MGKKSGEGKGRGKKVREGMMEEREGNGRRREKEGKREEGKGK